MSRSHCYPDSEVRWKNKIILAYKELFGRFSVPIVSRFMTWESRETREPNWDEHTAINFYSQITKFYCCDIRGMNQSVYEFYDRTHKGGTYLVRKKFSAKVIRRQLICNTEDNAERSQDKSRAREASSRRSGGVMKSYENKQFSVSLGTRKWFLPLESHYRFNFLVSRSQRADMLSWKRQAVTRYRKCSFLINRESDSGKRQARASERL